MTQLEHMTSIHENGIRAIMFEDPIHTTVFEFMVNYFEGSGRKAAPTWLAMETEYPSVPLDREVEEETQWLCDWLKKRFKRNKVQDIARRSAMTMDEDPDAALRLMWQDAYAATRAAAPRSTYEDMSQTKQQRRESYARDRDNPDIRGMSFGLLELDEHTRGLLPGELGIVAAYTKVGKSWLLANAFVSAHKTGKRPVLFTLEMDIEDMRERIDCLYSGVSYSRMVSRTLGFEEMDKLLAGQDELEAAGLAPLVRPERGDRTVKTMYAQARQMGGDVMLLDQLSWIDSEVRYSGDRVLTQKHGDLIYEVKDETSTASAGKLPTFMAVQHNRETVRGDNGGRGGLKNLANSASIEQTVDIALGLWQNQDMRNSNLMGLDIMGSRRGDRKSWMLNWHLTNRTEIRIAEEYEEAPAA